MSGIRAQYKSWSRVPASAVMTGMLLFACCGWAADATLEDRLAIEQVWAKYAQALDTADPEAYASLFTPDAYLEVDGKPYKGREAIQGLIRDMRKRLGIEQLPADARGRRFGPIRHILSNLIVDVQGDRATSESYWTEIITSGKDNRGIGKPPSVLKMGRYEDELVKLNGKWLYSRRIITGDLQMSRPELQ
jgi:ketosteroid isomerase-like protein